LTEPRRILIADDDPIALRLLEATIARWGYESIKARDGQEAWELLKENSDIALLLLDWNMPRMAGIDVCRKIREQADDHYRYVILITARSSKDDLIQALDAGADDYLTKPFNEGELHSRIKTGERIIELEKNLNAKISELEATLAEVRHVRSLLPICSYCKKIRDDKDYWHQLEKYIHERIGADFSHCICPQCMEKFVKPQLEEIKRKRKDCKENNRSNDSRSL